MALRPGRFGRVSCESVSPPVGPRVFKRHGMRRVALLIGLLAVPVFGQGRIRAWTWKELTEDSRMATVVTTWTNNSGDNEWSTDANWTNSSPTTAANNGNTVYAYLNGSVSNDDINGHDTTGDGGTGTLVQITAIDYEGNIGTSGDPLIFDIASTSAPVAGDDSYNVHLKNCTGSYFLKSDTGIGNFTDFVIDSPRVTQVELDGALNNLHFLAGRSITVLASASTSGKITIHGLADVTMNDAAKDVFADGGTLSLVGNVDQGSLIVVYGGTVTITGNLNTGGTPGTPGTLNVLAGTVEYAPSSDPAGKAWNYYIAGGTLDLRDSRFSIEAADLVIGPNGVVLGQPIAVTKALPTGQRIDLGEEFP